MNTITLARRWWGLVVTGLWLSICASGATIYDLGDIAVGGDGTGSAVPGLGLDTDTANFVPPDTFGGYSTNAPFFRPADGSGGSANLPFVDGVFVPRGVTQIDSTGRTFPFPSTGGGHFDAFRNAYAVFDRDVQPPPPRLIPIQLADQPGVNRRGLGIHSNSGITYDLAALRAAGAIFDAVRGVAGMNYDSVGTTGKVVIWVLVDGVPLYQQEFPNSQGTCEAFWLSLAPSDRFLSFVATDYSGSTQYDHSVIADAALVPEPTSLLFMALGGLFVFDTRAARRQRA